MPHGGVVGIVANPASAHDIRRLVADSALFGGAGERVVRPMVGCASPVTAPHRPHHFAGQVIAEVQVEKVSQDVEAPAGGVVHQVVAEGVGVRQGDVLATID